MRLPLTAALTLVLLLAPAQAPGQEASAAAIELRNRFSAALERAAAQADGVVSYSILDLTTGERFERAPGAVLATASTIKLAILYELFLQVQEGKLALDESRPLDQRHVVGGSGVLSQLTAPAMPLRDYATLMIVLSDNTATNALIDAVGMANVTRRMRELGLPATQLRRRMIDMDAALRGDENVSTAAEITTLLLRLHEGRGLSKAHHQQLLEILQKPKSTPLHRGVPAGVPVASKSGSLDGIQVDAGIVYLEGRPYIISVMTAYLKRAAEGSDAIAAISEIAFGHFNRVAKSSEYGRIIR